MTDDRRGDTHPGPGSIEGTGGEGDPTRAPAVSARFIRPAPWRGRAMPAQNTTAGSEETEKMVERPEHLIEQAVCAGVDLDEIEKRIINTAPLDEERRAALWLYAEALCARHLESLPERFLPVG